MGQRKTWLLVNKKQVENGTLDKNYVINRIRYLRTIPDKKLNGYDPRFKLFKDLMLSKGYQVRIYENGTIELEIPCSDKYGPILREIATLYYLVEKAEELVNNAPKGA